MNKNREATVFECDICGHNFDVQGIVQFGSDILWACFFCIETKWKKIGKMLIEMEK